MDEIDVHDEFPTEELDVNFFDPCGGSVFGGTQENVGDGLVTGSAEGAGEAAKKKEEDVSSSPGGGSLDEVPAVPSDVVVRSASARKVVKGSAVRKESKRDLKDVSAGDGVRLTLCLDPELVDGLRLLARVKGRTMSSLVVSALVCGLDDDSRVDEEKDNFRKVVNGFLARYGK